MDKLWCIQTMEYYSVLKGSELPRKIWRNLKCILPSERKWKCQLLSCVWVSATPWTVARQAPLSMVNPGPPQRGQVLTIWATGEAHQVKEASLKSIYDSTWSSRKVKTTKAVKSCLVPRGSWASGTPRVPWRRNHCVWSCSSGIHVTVCSRL